MAAIHPCWTLLLLVLATLPSARAVIEITYKEEQCLEKTAKLFEKAGEDLLEARREFQIGMEMTMTSTQKMKAVYPEGQLKRYDTFCRKYGGNMHIIKIDFFDCILRKSPMDVELTIKNFANCMANVDECVDFGQEHLLQEAWHELGLDCTLEEEETKKDDYNPNPNKKKKNDYDALDDDLVKREKEAAAEGADDVDKEEKKSEYIPKEEQGKNGKRKKKGGFIKFLLLMSICAFGYYAFDRHRKGYPIELPCGRLPFVDRFSSSTTNRFAQRPQTGFVSDYNLLSAQDENELQLSSNYP